MTIFEIILLFLTTVTTIFWPIYVYLTYKTFREIKNQTILQHRALLSIVPFRSKIDEVILNQKAVDIHNKWKDILKGNSLEERYRNSMFVLRLANRGRSDIVEWNITINLEISPGKYLEKKLNQTIDREKWIIESDSSKQILPNKEIDIPILFLGYFPKARITWKVKYKDLRDETYIHDFGNNYHLFVQDIFSKQLE